MLRFFLSGTGARRRSALAEGGAIPVPEEIKIAIWWCEVLRKPVSGYVAYSYDYLDAVKAQRTISRSTSRSLDRFHLQRLYMVKLMFPVASGPAVKLGNGVAHTVARES
ncbi:unnamed protein product [Nippostrongylus brasiliensis]|uniref:Uncharacterized protein n=1 Tax=Nippostrongylus brasiliensis TaxID=27835 RepID=A0A0N4XFD5_NIPBR|nr:unnamed protein product [Nippostrongylus brasiliensis]